MTSATARQRYLYLVARLYDVASEFSDSDLDAMRAVSRADDNKAILGAIELLKQLHGASPVRAPVKIRSRELDIQPFYEHQAPQSSSRRGTWNDRAFVSLLEDKELFPTVRDVAVVLPINVEPRPKEARARYVQRVMQEVRLLSEAEKLKFRDHLMSVISSRPTGFVSRWTSLIKDL